MSNLDAESLFSLELVVEELALLPNVACRFPSIAFRLLDFPTLVIHHVNFELALTIRARAASERRYKPPLQFHELQDSAGHFPVQKGKSCLFKVSPNMLLTHLSNAPLYVMALDTYPETPKLLGTCTIPLDITMDHLYASICSMGVSIPAVSGDKGSYEIFTLMGRRIGSITAGFRLLSLGVALLPHIPDRAIARLGVRDLQPSLTSHPSSAGIRGGVAVTDNNNDRAEELWQDQDPERRKTIDAILSGLEMNGGSLPTAQIEISPSVITADTQTERIRRESISTQTVKKKKPSPAKKRGVAIQRDSDSDDELIPTDITCPPPLFYNSALEPELSASTYGQFQAHHGPYQAPRQAAYREGRIIAHDEDSDDGTIRSEDNFSESELVGDPRHQSKMANHDGRQNGRDRKPPSVNRNKIAVGKDVFSKSIKQVSIPLPVDNFNQFPILQALMAEILTLQGGDVVAAGARQYEYGKSNQRRGVGFVSNRSSASPAMAHHRECAAAKILGETPKTKSWIRVEPRFLATPASNKRSNLTSGLTNTLRLRLARTNPNLLRQLEEREKERVEEWKEQQRLLKGGEAFRSADVSNASVPYSAAVHQQSEAELDAAIAARYHKRPVPTPRESILALNDNGVPRRLTRVPAEREYVMESENFQPNFQEDHHVKEDTKPRAERRNIMRSSFEEKIAFIEEDEDGETLVGGDRLKHQAKEESTKQRNDQRRGLNGKSPFGQTQVLATSNLPALQRGEGEELRTRGDEGKKKGETFKVPSSATGKETAQEAGRRSEEDLPASGLYYSDDFEEPTNRDENYNSRPQLSAVPKAAAVDDDDFDLNQLRKIVERYSDDDDDDGGGGQTAREPQLKKYVERYSDDESDDSERAPTVGKDTDWGEGIDGKTKGQGLKGVEPKVKKVTEHSDDDDDDVSRDTTSSFKLREEVVRKKIVRNSDDDDSSSRRSSPDHQIESRVPARAGTVNPITGSPNLSVKLSSIPNPAQSTRSPIPAIKGSLESARQPIAGSSTPSPDSLSPRKVPYVGNNMSGAKKTIQIDKSPRRAVSPKGKSALSQELDDLTISSTTTGGGVGGDGYSEDTFEATADDDMIMELRNAKDVKL